MSLANQTKSTTLLVAIVTALGAGTLASLPAQAGPSLRATVAVDALFGGLDLNHDGKLDQSEMDAARAARFAHLDTNHDGTISQAEMQQAEDRIQRRAATMQNLMVSRFQALDTNGDGVVSKEEFMAAKNAMPLLVDSNGDGAVSRDEVLKLLSALPAFQ